MADDYEILPHGELEQMRGDIKQIKENPFGQTETGQTMLDAMNNLSTSINRLLSVLESANDEIVRDYEENKTSDRMDMIIEQNTKLAEGMVALGELVKNIQQEQKRTAAFSAGLDEVSTFSTDAGDQPNQKNQKSQNSPNPFQGQEDKLEENLPRQTFNNPDSEKSDELPSVKGLPPPPKGMPPIQDVPRPQ